MKSSSFWIAIYLILLAIPLFLMLVPPRPESLGFAWDVSIALGFIGLTMMAVQFALTARFHRATAPFGIDLIYYFHRYVAVIALWVIIVHPVILFVLNPGLLPMLNPLDAPAHMVAGLGSLVVFLLLIVTSLFRKALKWEYEWWRIGHGLLAVAGLLLAWLHVRGVGYFANVDWKKWTWTGIVMVAPGLFLYVRILKPWLLIRRPFRVIEVRKERGNAWTIAVEPDGHTGFSFEPGQFAWLTLRGSPFAMKEHPFSISSSPAAAPRLEFTIKELGDFTSTVGEIRTGERAYVDGPFGSFSVNRFAAAPGFVFIAGGIGLAPMMSMIRSLADRSDRRPIFLFCANSAWERIPFREAIHDLKARLPMTVVHLLEEPPETWDGERGYFTRAILERHIPAGAKGHEYFICGPLPMIRSVEQLLTQVGIPMKQMHTELFDLV